MYLKGKGTEKNYKKAYEHFKKAAEKENADGNYYLGYMLENKLVFGISED